MEDNNDKDAIKLKMKMVMKKSKTNRWGPILTLILWALIIASPCDSDAMGTVPAETPKQLVTLETCPGATEGGILVGGESRCYFDYETGSGFCGDDAFGAIGGNRLLIKGPAGFGIPGGRFDISVEMMIPGSYFSDVKSASLWGFSPSQNACAGNLENEGGKKITPTFTMYTKDGPTERGPDDSCSLASVFRVNKIATSGGAITGLDAYTTLFLDLPLIVFDTTIIGSGATVTLQITMTESTSGQILSDTITLGTFETACGNGNDVLRGFFPIFPGTDNTGWWSSFVIVNRGPSEKTVSLIYTDTIGNQACYTTAPIAPGDHFQSSAISFNDLSPVKGVFTGAANYSVTLSGDSYSNDGVYEDYGPYDSYGIYAYGFIGNQDQATSYRAYSPTYQGCSSWQTDLFFPYMPGSTGSGWGGIFEITNGSPRTGKATLVFTDIKGNTATYTTPDIPGGGQWSLSSMPYGDLTQVNGDFRFSENYSVKVQCGFCLAGGFAYLINDGQATCYKAYSSRWED